MMQLKKIMKYRFGNNRGFTLIEVIAVLVILSIIAVVIISRGTSTADVDIKARAEALKSHIRFVQIRAMNMTSSDSGCNAPFGMVMTSGYKYYMFKDCDIDSKVVLPGAESADGVELPSSSSNETFSFDNWGAPYLNYNALGTSSDIPLSFGGESIIITKNTGYVP